MKWIVLWVVAGLSFVGGWVCGVWLCSKRRWCPLYLQRALYEWKVTIQAEQAKRNQEREKEP